jgi:aryl-alcohol dehydrogenase-like predicted oxidoreductase
VTLAVAFTLARDFVASTIIGATRPEQLDESLAAASVTLAPAALDAIDKLTREILYPMG